ncbi:Golgin candidate 1 [Linum grandiflorum]
MAAWLKAAEGLFEVVDRQAKLVVNELSEEQPDSLPPASNGQGSQARKTKTKPKPNSKSKSKAQKRLPKEESTIASESVQEPTRTQPSEADLINRSSHSVQNDENVSSSSIVQNDENVSSSSIAQTSNEQEQTIDIVASSVALPESTNDPVKHEADTVEIPETVTDPVLPSSKSEILNSKASDVQEKDPSSPLPATETEVAKEHGSIISVLDTRATEIDVSSKTGQEKSSEDSLVSNENSAKDDDVKVESPAHQKKKLEHKTDDSPGKIQEQLEEAQGLLKTANATGQSKEARLARVCAGLSTRLQEYKSENAQLEELLIAERELSKSYEARIKQLQEDLSMSKHEVTRVESNMTEALAAKNAEIAALLGSMDALKKQAALSEGSLASLQANMESLMRNRELSETRMMQALREELASVERRAEEERVAHNATKKAAMEREMDLENRAVEASTALARTQRVADERTGKASELEQKVALLEVECATLNQELQDMEARVRRGQKKSPEELNQSIQMQAWQEEVERARQGQRDAENKLSSVETELQKLRVEMAAMKRDGEHYSRQWFHAFDFIDYELTGYSGLQEHTELEKRYRELTDLLYYKQTQLETMASEKAAAEFQLEKEMKRLQEAQVEAERSRVARRPSTSWEEDAEMKTLESTEIYILQLQKAAKLLDSGAARATRFLWRYPTARLIFLFYLVRALGVIRFLFPEEQGKIGRKKRDIMTKKCAGIRASLHDVSIASPSGASGRSFGQRRCAIDGAFGPEVVVTCPTLTRYLVNVHVFPLIFTVSEGIIYKNCSWSFTEKGI